MKANANKVRSIVFEHLCNTECHSVDGIKDNETFIDMGADSLDEIELVISFELAFDIAIKDEDAEKIKTISQAISYLTNL